jgi:hypothetical protein
MSLKDEYKFKKEITNATRSLVAEYLSICRDLNDDEKRVTIVLFLQEALADCKTEPAIISGGGKFGEILAAHKRGCTMNSSMTGVDMTDNETGEPQEQKTSTGTINKKANFNFELPKCQNPTMAEYQNMIKTTTLAKGDVYFTHMLSASESYEYTLSKEFVAELLSYKWTANTTSFKINLGGMPCKHCRHVHRMLNFMALDGEWSKLGASKHKFDWARTGKVIPSSERCNEFKTAVFGQSNNNNNNNKK